jgi:hypothetical protein
VLSSWFSGYCSRAGLHLADRLRVGFCPGVLRVFLSAFILIRLASGVWWKVVWRTVRATQVAHGPSEDVVRTVRVLRCRLGRSVSV